jgi:hypothetical protein
MRCLRVLVIACVATGCSAENEPRSAPVPVRSDEHRLSYALPAGWERASQSLTPDLGNPIEILAAGTVRDMRAAPDRCAHMPVGAIERMTPSDAFVSVMERYGEMPAPPRPAQFALPAKQEQSDATECARGEPPLDVYWFEFAEARRWFHVLVALGREAGPERRAEALALLDSLHFEPGPEGVHLDPDRTIPMHDTQARLSWQEPHPPWRRYDWPLTSLREPRQRLVLGTFDLERGPPDPECLPQATIDGLPPDGALLYVLEYVEHADSWRARVRERTEELTLGAEAQYECAGRSHVVRWRERDRVFQAHVMFGPRAGEELRDEARSILNSIRAD